MLLNDCNEVVISPEYDYCKGFFEGNTFMDSSWSSLEDSKIEESNNWFSRFLQIETEGEIVISDDFFNSFGENYEVALSFKAGNQFSVFFWDSPTSINQSTISYQYSGSDLSNAELFVKEATPVPEPSGFFGLIAALVFLIVFKFVKK